MLFICGVIFIIIGGLAFWKPELIWEITEQWKSYDAGEPSGLYLFSTKFGGIMFILVGIAAVIVQFI